MKNIFLEKLEFYNNLEGRKIVITRGIPNKWLPPVYRYFSEPMPFLDKFNESNWDSILMKDFRRNGGDTYNLKVMTYEEFSRFKQFIQFEDAKLFLLTNNLYGKQFPYDNTMYDIDKVYENLYYEDNTELTDEHAKLLDNVSMFYGRIDKSPSSGYYYITYNDFDFPFDDVIELFDSNKDKEYQPKFKNRDNEAPQNSTLQLELTADEKNFLDLTQTLLSNPQKRNSVEIIVKDTDIELYSFLWPRIHILENVYNVSFVFSFTTIKRNNIIRENEYLSILKQKFKYSSFKEIEFYSNIENKSKETIKLSQAQIIDDIVNQSELSLSGQLFNDVFVTASTGSGKSLMYQIPAVYLTQKHSENKPLTIVISPLIGLMNDQLDGLLDRGIANAATIHSNSIPQQKERILNEIREQKIDIVYLSPETLQSNFEIQKIIDSRRIGFVVIDEAHIVTTWGKSFRADYWYLGTYLNRLRKKNPFPIVTFTATAIYGGEQDMYSEMRENLNLISPISYFGQVKRSDIMMNVRSSKEAQKQSTIEYRKKKFWLTSKMIEFSAKRKEKLLIYFPTIRLINEFKRYMEANNPKLAVSIGIYHGKLVKEEKDATLINFKEGHILTVLATKAFGMGIDIQDIKNVYHFAPTGSVLDYIQEIGRAARLENMIGEAWIDYLEQDFSEVNKLYGMSAIRHEQIIDVMKKIVSIYKQKKFKRNILISADDFKYIFEDTERDDTSSLDNKVKTVLLMIEKDFSSAKKIGFAPFTARPKTLVGSMLAVVSNENAKKILNSKFSKYIKSLYKLSGNRYEEVLSVDLAQIWEKYYSTLSFAEFKYSLFSHQVEEVDKLENSKILKLINFGSGIEILRHSDANEIINTYKNVLNALKQFLDKQSLSGKWFKIESLAKHLNEELKFGNVYEASSFAQIIINLLLAFSQIKETKIIDVMDFNYHNEISYKLVSLSNFDLFYNEIVNNIRLIMYPKDNYVEINDETHMIFFGTQYSGMQQLTLETLGIGNTLGLISFQVVGGNNPQISLRINSIGPLELAINGRNRYRNAILDQVKSSHFRGINMLRYLFSYTPKGSTLEERKSDYTTWFWNSVEDYLMGMDYPVE